MERSGDTSLVVGGTGTSRSNIPAGGTAMLEELSDAEGTISVGGGEHLSVCRLLVMVVVDRSSAEGEGKEGASSTA